MGQQAPCCANKVVQVCCNEKRRNSVHLAFEPKREVMGHWTAVHEAMADDTLTVPVPRHVFVQYCKSCVYPDLVRSPSCAPVPETVGAFEVYVDSLVDAVLGLTLPSVRVELGKHAFSYAVLLAGEFYGSAQHKGEDRLSLAALRRPTDEFGRLRDTLDADWSMVQKDPSGRADLVSFVSHFTWKHSSLLNATSQSYREFLERTFKACLAMMLPVRRQTLGGHPFRYGALLAGEFHFPSVEDKSGAADVLELAVLEVPGVCPSRVESLREKC